MATPTTPNPSVAIGDLNLEWLDWLNRLGSPDGVNAALADLVARVPVLAQHIEYVRIQAPPPPADATIAIPLSLLSAVPGVPGGPAPAGSNLLVVKAKNQFVHFALRTLASYLASMPIAPAAPPR